VVKAYEHIVTINIGNQDKLSTMTESILGIRGSLYRMGLEFDDPQEMAKLQSQLLKNREDYESADKAYQAIPFVEGEDALYKAVNDAREEVKRNANEMMSIAKENTKEAKIEFLERTKKFGPIVTHFREKMQKLNDFQDQETKKWSESASNTAKTSTTITFILIAVGSFFALILGWILSTRLSNTLGKVTDEINSTANQVASASQQLASASHQVSAGSTEAAASLAETVASVEEIGSMVKQNADNANQAASLSSQSSQTAEHGEVEIRNLISSINEITNSSKKISEIIDVIDDIAFQTNLLALNAAVEAARAGEQGKGFAVVAEAVRNLAQKSAEAAKDISGLIQDSVSKIERGSKIADQSGEVLKNIVTSVKKVSDLNNEIASASQEQATGISQIGKAMNQLDASTQQNASASEEVAASSEEMSSQANVLKELVSDLNEVIYGADQNGRHNSHPNNHQFDNKKTQKPHSNTHAKNHYAEKPKHKGQGNNVTHLPSNVIPFGDENSSKNDNNRVAKVGTTDGF
jgi:methyl-accepting chemotaxis protein